MDSRQIAEIRHVAERRARFGNTKYETRNGSAIIIAVVLTMLLAIVGVLFLFSSRVDSVATSAVGDNHDLKLAVDTVVAQISQVLVNNVPGVGANSPYYTYPDGSNHWLASLEPSSANAWLRVTDLYNSYGSYANNFSAAAQIPEYPSFVLPTIPADADGDGVSDSFWVQVKDVNSSKGKPIFAAVRIIDNGAMLNVNTAYKFDPASSVGATQSDINLMALAALDNTHTAVGEKESRLLSYRCGSGPNDITLYTNNVVWKYDQPVSPYTPFDISDELVLRYRYILNSSQMTTRIENLWTNAFKGGLSVPRTTTNDANWFWVVSDNYPSPCADPCVYDYQHIATTYNMDRIIAPDGNKMFDVNQGYSSNPSNITALRDKIRAVLDPNVYDANQIAVNLVNYIDTDSNVVYFVDPCTSKSYFGFARPCVYISEVAENFYQDPNGHDTTVYRSYAIELYKPYPYPPDDAPNGWDVNITDDNGTTRTIPISGWTATNPFHVLAKIDLVNANIPVDTNVTQNDVRVDFGLGTTNADITLWRDVNGYGPMIVDSFIVPRAGSGWMDTTGIAHNIERDITVNRCIKRIQNPNVTNTPTLGSMNNYKSGSDTIQAHPTGKPFTNIGEIGQLFWKDAYLIGPNDTEATVRLNIADANVQNLFKYLTVIDPTPYTGDPNETRIKGRININTAPWFVLAQLPWISYQMPNYDIARAIVNDRDTYGAFKSTAELMRVTNLSNMSYYQGNAIPIGLATPTDCNGDAFEERDVIFDRISNLITVRSDVFTAYILVRIGPSGPQKRVIAIFDRSGVTSTGGKVKIVAIQQVPDPR